MAPSSKSPTVDRLLAQADKLPPTERMVLRLKALIGPATNKGEFLSAMNATGTRGHARICEGEAEWHSYSTIPPLVA